MRQNKDVFELFHNFDMELNMILIYIGKNSNDFRSVFSIIYENFKYGFILSHRVALEDFEVKTLRTQKFQEISI